MAALFSKWFFSLDTKEVSQHHPWPILVGSQTSSFDWQPATYFIHDAPLVIPSMQINCFTAGLGSNGKPRPTTLAFAWWARFLCSNKIVLATASGATCERRPRIRKKLFSGSLLWYLWKLACRGIRLTEGYEVDFRKSLVGLGTLFITNLVQLNKQCVKFVWLVRQKATSCDVWTRLKIRVPAGRCSVHLSASPLLSILNPPTCKHLQATANV